jgi:hypothetical protein
MQRTLGNAKTHTEIGNKEIQKHKDPNYVRNGNGMAAESTETRGIAKTHNRETKNTGNSSREVLGNAGK